jgi:hypothetical protein
MFKKKLKFNKHNNEINERFHSNQYFINFFFYYVGFLKKAVHIENKQARIKNQPEL